MKFNRTSLLLCLSLFAMISLQEIRSAGLGSTADGLLQNSAAPGERPDPSAGWAILLMADHKGDQDKTVYDSVQKDAKVAFQALTQKMGVQPDHIVMLAEGECIEEFVKSGPAVSASTGLLSKISSRPQGTAFRDAFAQGEPRSVPFLGKPTAENFRLAKDVLSSLAGAHQYFAMVVSMHGQLGQVSGGETSSYGSSKRILLLPRGADGSTGAGCLIAKDFQLSPECRALYRIVIADACYSGELAKELVPGRSSVSVLEKEVSEELAGDTKQSVPIVMSSSSVYRPSVATDGGSPFLQALFDIVLHPDPEFYKGLKGLAKLEDGTVGVWFKAAKSALGKIAPDQEPLLRPDCAGTADMGVLIVSPLKAEHRERMRTGARAALQSVANEFTPEEIRCLAAIADRYVNRWPLTLHEKELAYWIRDRVLSNGASPPVAEVKKIFSKIKEQAGKLIVSTKKMPDPLVANGGQIVAPVFLSVEGRDLDSWLILVNTSHGIDKATGQKLTAEVRGEMIKDRVNELLEKVKTGNPLSFSDVRAEQTKKGEWVVKAPVAEGHLVTIDDSYAQLSNRTPQELALDMAEQVRHQFDPGGWVRDITDEALKQFSYGLQEQAVLDNNMLGHLRLAIEHYRKAVSESPDYAVAALSLGQAYLKLAKQPGLDLSQKYGEVSFASVTGIVDEAKKCFRQAKEFGDPTLVKRADELMAGQP